MPTLRVSSLALSSLVALAASGFAADKITYVDQVLPILRNACLNCHNPDKKKAGLDMTTYGATMAGSENGPIIKPGQADASLMFKVCAQTEEPKMPPKGDKLTDAELATLKSWIAGFALETATSKPAAVQNSVALAVVSLEKPAGPPPMPGDLPLEPFVRPKANTAVTALAVSPWAPLVAIGGQKQVTLYNTETLQEVGVLPFPEGFPQVIKFSRNGQLLMIGGGLGGKSGKVTLWNVLTGQRVGSVGDEQDQVLAADVSPDHGFVALGGPSKTLKIFSTKDGKLLHTIKRHTEWVTAVAFSPDGKFLASGDRNGGVMVWEGTTGKEYNALAGHKLMVTALAFMPGILASASTEGKITLWDVKEGKEIRSWAAHNGGVEWIDFTPDGRLVSCGRDKLAKVWDQNGKVIATSPAFTDIALRAGLSNDRIIATDWTGRIQVCKLDGKPVGDLAANPAPIAEQLAATEKRLTDTKAALPGLQQAATTAEQTVKTEKDAIEAKHKADLAAVQKTQDDAQKAIEAGKAQVAAQEKHLADLRAEGEQLKTANNAAKQAVEAAKKIAAEKKLSSAPDPAAEQEVVAKTAAAAEAAKKLAAQPAIINAAQGETQKAKAQLPKTVAASEKAIAEAKKQLTALNTPPAPKPLPSEEALAKAKAAVDEATATIASATSDLEHWRRGQAFMNVHRAENSYSELKAKHEELIATAKDAFTPVEQIRAQIAALAKSTADAPPASAKVQAEATAAAKADEAAIKANAAATADVKAKEAAASIDPKAVEGEIAAAQKKLEGVNAEAAKRKDALAKTAEGSPERTKADADAQAVQKDVAAADKALADAKARLADATAKRAAFAAAQEAQKKAQETESDAHTKSLAALRALTKLQQTAEADNKQLAELRAKEPKLAQDAAAAKARAEQDAAAIAKQLDPAKEAATKVRAEFESKWHAHKQASAN